jgi:hypothetical protein
LASTAACAPLPSASIEITDATPITIPSVVNPARSILPKMPFSAVLTVFNSVMFFSAHYSVVSELNTDY